MIISTQTTYPFCLQLPDGDALLIPGSAERGQPCYARNGQSLEIDVTIPDDLTEHFYWWGSFLALKVDPGKCGVLIATCTYGVPGVYDQARSYLAKRAEVRAMRAAERPKKTKRPSLPKGVQQMELGL